MNNKHEINRVADGVVLDTHCVDKGLDCQTTIKAPVEVAGEFPALQNPGEVPIEFKAGYPPNIKAIAKVLPEALRDKGVIFTYGRVIYVANGKPLPRSLVAHECVHVQQQDMFGRDEWWDRYLRDKKFRFQMELAAHRLELSVAISEGNREHRRKVRKMIAKRLSGPLYGRGCTFAQARRLLEATDASA